jgi:hypothetical protein
MSNHKIDFANGHLFCKNSQEDVEIDLVNTLDIHQKMDEYYKQSCVVRHWKQHTIKSGEWVESQMSVKDAIYQIKEGWLEKATFRTGE